MTAMLSGLLAIIIEAILKVFTSKFFMKAIMAASVYVFLFTIIPALIQYLVPDAILKAAGTYADMLGGGPSSVTCSGTVPVATQGPNTSVSCSSTVTMVAFGSGVLFILQWLQFTALLGVMLPVMAVSFLFKRI